MVFRLFGGQNNTGSDSPSVFRLLIYLGAFAVFITVGALFLVFLGIRPFPKISQLPLYLTYALTIEMLAMVVVIAYRFVRLYSTRVGSRLQQRMVFLIAILVSTPVLLISGFSILFLEVGLETWISRQVKTALEESQNVADAYLEEHRQTLISDIISIARSFDQTFLLRNQQDSEIKAFLDFNTQARQITQALILRVRPDGTSEIITRSGFSVSLELDPVSSDDIQRASRGEVILILGRNIDQAKGLVKLQSSNNLYLYAGRYVSPQIVQQTQTVKGAVRNFTILEEQLQNLKFGFIITFVLVTFLCILIGVYLSLNLARSIAAPISRLTEAARAVGKGNFHTKVPTDNLPQDETAELTHTFNAMSQTLGDSRDELMAANANIAENRDFIENILRSVSTGIVGLDQQGKVLSINQRALDMLGYHEKESHNIDIMEFFPEINRLIDQAQVTKNQDFVEHRLSVSLESGAQRIFLVRLVKNSDTGALQYILSLEDISELENAQRLAAWSEVAKRIAHEIHNPLTPIRLATERLRRKYPKLLKNIQNQDVTLVSENDITVMQQSSATILRQVDNIALMVKEFSDFARMPKANLQMDDLVDICREAVFIEENREQSTPIRAELPENNVFFPCDRRQLLQVLVNLLKNAAEAMLENTATSQLDQGIILRLMVSAPEIVIEVEDHGPGWPAMREKLFDPYHTTREKGTGLGLAIVHRIVSEHRGECKLRDAEHGGAIVHLTFSLTSEQTVDDEN